MESNKVNIKKVRRVFFALGLLGISRGKQNPLTVSEMFEVCVLPICLYGCENRLLTDSLLQLLENVQAKMGKRLLDLPKHHANLCPLVALGWPSIALTHPQEKAELLSSTYAS